MSTHNNTKTGNKMNDSLNIVIPNHPAMLSAVGKALQEMAGKTVKEIPLPVGAGKDIVSPAAVKVKPASESARAVTLPSQAPVVIENDEPLPVVELHDEEVSPEVVPTPPIDIPLDPTTDITGRPWDARIDSGGKSLLASGAWKKKRGVDDATYAAVVAEIDTNAEAPAAVPVTSAVPAPPAVVPAPPAGIVPGVAPAPQPPAMLEEQSMTFAEFMTWLTGEAIGKFLPEHLNAACAANGVADISQLGNAANAHLVLGVKTSLVGMAASV